MTEYFNGFSNVDDWISLANLENTNTIVWHTFHQKYWKYQDLIKIPNWQSADRIFLVGQEADIDYMLDIDPRIHVWDSLVKPGVERFHSYFWWWWQTVEVNDFQKLTDKLTNPIESNPKYIFDCIMGGSKIHRDYIYNCLTNDTDVKNLCLIKYKNDKWLPGTNTDSEENLKNYAIASGYSNKAGTLLPFDGVRTANVATWVPWQIYNQSWFSIVAETRYNQNFFTEKTAKAILAKKLFIIIGAEGALRDLKHLGFKTFDGIIDESYDRELDDYTRWRCAFEQVRFLCSQSPHDIYQKILPILEHNQNLMLTLDWKKQAINEMKNIVHGN